MHNALIQDLESDANAARPVTAGGTGGATAVDGHDNLSTKGTNIASATTTDIGAASGAYVHITGTTPINGLGSKTAGVGRIVVFDGILTLTHNATSLILPGGANITTAAGDVAVMVSEGSGNWRCVAYSRAAGNAKAGANTDITSLYLNNTGLKIKDINASHGLSIVPGSNITADRTLTITTGDADRTLTLSADVTLDQSVATNSTPQFTGIQVGHASDTTITRVSPGVIAIEGATVVAAVRVSGNIESNRHNFGGSSSGVTMSDNAVEYVTMGGWADVQARFTFTNNGSGSGSYTVTGSGRIPLPTFTVAAHCTVITGVSSLSGGLMANINTDGSIVFRHGETGVAVTDTNITNTADFILSAHYPHQ